MTAITGRTPLGQLLRRPPRYGINAAAVPLTPSIWTYIRITDINESGRFAPNPKVGVDHPCAESYRLARGELLFARTGASVGKSYLYDPRDGELIYAGFLINVAPDPALLNPKYLALFAQTKEYWDWITRTSVRSGQPGVNGREYAQLLVPVPELAVQDAIASSMADVDDLIVTLERLIAKKQAIKQGMLQQLLTGKTRVPGFAEPWWVDSLGSLCAIRSGRPKNRVAGGRYWVVDMGSVTRQAQLVVTRKTEDSSDLLRSGDLVMPKDDIGGGQIIGRAGLIPKSGVYALADHVYALSPRGVDPGFLNLAINSDEVILSLRSLATGSAQLGLSKRSVANQRVTMPTSIDEQRAIARVLIETESEIASLRARLFKAMAIKQGMMQELLSGRTRLPAQRE